jgi:hypothetical protein
VVTVQSVSFRSADVTGRASTTGIVTLSARPSAPVSVALTSSRPAVATVPGKIAVTGQTGSFTIRAVPGPGGCSKISAQVVGTGPRPGALLFVQPTNAPGPVALTLPVSNTVVAGGLPLSGLVTAFLPAGTSQVVVQLTSNNPLVTVPASLTLAETEGGPFQSSFNITAAANAAPDCAIITATFQGSQNRALVKVVIIGG